MELLTLIVVGIVAFFCRHSDDVVEIVIVDVTVDIVLVGAVLDSVDANLLLFNFSL